MIEWVQGALVEVLAIKSEDPINGHLHRSAGPTATKSYTYIYVCLHVYSVQFNRWRPAGCAQGVSQVDTVTWSGLSLCQRVSLPTATCRAIKLSILAARTDRTIRLYLSTSYVYTYIHTQKCRYVHTYI